MLPQRSMLYDRSNPSFSAPASLREWFYHGDWMKSRLAVQVKRKLIPQYRPSLVTCSNMGSRPPLFWTLSSKMRPLHSPGLSTLQGCSDFLLLIYVSGQFFKPDSLFLNNFLSKEKNRGEKVCEVEWKITKGKQETSGEQRYHLLLQGNQRNQRATFHMEQ